MRRQRARSVGQPLRSRRVGVGVASAHEPELSSVGPFVAEQPLVSGDRVARDRREMLRGGVGDTALPCADPSAVGDWADGVLRGVGDGPLDDPPRVKRGAGAGVGGERDGRPGLASPGAWHGLARSWAWCAAQKRIVETPLADARCYPQTAGTAEGLSAGAGP